MPTRIKNVSTIPGIINLPQPKSQDSPPSSPNLRHPGSSPRLKHTATLDKPLPTLHDPAHKDVEGRRRRRGKQNRMESPLKQVVDTEEDPAPIQPVSSSPPADTPTKARRRRGGRANRQASPPLPEQQPTSPEAPFPSTTPPQSDYDPLSSIHSRSVPLDPILSQQLRPRTRLPDAQSSSDEWEMPAAAKTGDKAKQNLSWQQELLRNGSSTANGSKQRGSGGNESPASRPRSRVSGKDARTTGSVGSLSSFTSSSGITKVRPPLHASKSEHSTAGGPSLNWQQELLLQTPDLSTLRQPSPVKPSSLTPARQRRFQNKDNITFGLADLDLDADEIAMVDDIFSPSRGGRSQPPHLSQPSSRNGAGAFFVAATGPTTPVKTLEALEPRYAGPTFQNSPAPSSLPVPTFMLRKQGAPIAA
ncbi:hypothetical protein JCM11641_006833 [Rhodosporidiobolus odoratus]